MCGGPGLPAELYGGGDALLKGAETMDLAVAFIVFIVSMVGAIFLDISMLLALFIGLAAFLFVGVHRGFSPGNLLHMGFEAVKESMGVIEVMLIIGFITATWRISGTITIFVYYGIQVITPPLFLMVTFLLSCLLSYALGTSFGVAGTVGVIFMALARSGGVDPVIAGGVIMSGIYFGDRCSPVSSSANMIAGITGTEIYDNVKLMVRTALLPMGITLAAYGVLSAANPIKQVDEALVRSFEESFSLSLWAFVPAILMLLLPLLRVKVRSAMAASIISGVLVAWLVQGVPLFEIAKTCVLGYRAQGDGLGTILNGGGLVSMLEVAGILVLSSTYSGIFSGTDMLRQLQDMLGRACTRLGRFSVMVLVSTAMAVIFCNQTISTLMCSDLLKQPYAAGGGSKEELAQDMENSVILIACLIPWSIGCSVPLSFLGAGYNSLPYAVYMYAVPICYWFTKRRWFGSDRGLSAAR